MTKHPEEEALVWGGGNCDCELPESELQAMGAGGLMIKEEKVQ